MDIKICDYTNCNAHATHGYFKGDRKYCVKHRLYKMLRYDSLSFCQFEGCKNRGIFYYQNMDIKMCAKHKHPNMTQVATISICSTYGCETKANFGFPGDNIEKCGKHREPGHINLVHFILCKHSSCNNIIKRPPSKNTDPSKYYCNDHSDELSRLPEFFDIDCSILDNIDDSNFTTLEYDLFNF